MNVLYREAISDIVAEKLRLSKVDTDLILYNYIKYMQEKLTTESSVNILNICYIINNDVYDSDNYTKETMAYVSTELAKITNMGSETINRVLLTLQDMIISEVDTDKSYCLRGLIRVRYVKDENGVVKPRVRKSSVFNSYNKYRISATNFFRRKVGESNAG